MRLHGIDPKPHVPWAFIFKGAPGTGKTSTARKVGRLYYDMGLLSTDEVVTCSVTDLVGEHVGQTGPKVLNTLETGLGKVLFVDEAYRLDSTSIFHTEAVEELVDAMTQPRYSKNMVIILAGYTTEMDNLLGINPGLRSRFPEHVLFPSLSPRACFEHLRNEVQKINVSFEEPSGADGEKSMKMVYLLFAKLSQTRGWANGRDVETLSKTIVGNVYIKEGRARKEGGPLGSLVVTIDELVHVLKAMRKERKVRNGQEAEE
jgi:SpoVK/Ycf46/Vps4 family AAA+-type ATPase